MLSEVLQNTKRIDMKRTLLFMVLVLASLTMLAQEYYPEGTKWTEIRLDTLKYDSWYSKVGDEWVPNFETIEYYVKGEYTTEYGEKYKCIYTNGPEWTDSLTLGIQEGGNNVIVTAFVYDYDGVYVAGFKTGRYQKAGVYAGAQFFGQYFVCQPYALATCFKTGRWSGINNAL